ncbi:flagellar basal body P-ring formation chaperone FlgA [Rhodopseudomonas sp. BR0M22]|uniref:flagellar basal body P-ring formation chaperone FlgA n=1 Tax=Rhodopseudomonas sp. BR0M22 TaxID=2269369 RepID=UPI0013E0AC4D|nr:flagellar basal body P-ring formation chaperone FlgA [Rhodopseudomonas sp. BR0M22]NEW90586.1 flagella basal body P-ring formation protein FlgA [Rhodopseudomonas sp. BR0M22]
MIRTLLLAASFVAAAGVTASGQTAVPQAQPAAELKPSEVLKTPVLRPHVEVTGELVRIGDVIDNAGPAADIAIYRSPDLGTTGALPTATVLAALRAHQVIGVDTRDISEITVTRLARTLAAKEIEQQVIRTLQQRHNLGEAEDITVSFDRDVETKTLPAIYAGALQLVSERFDLRSGRFDISYEISGGQSTAPARMRVTGTAIETVMATVLTRPVQRNDVIKASDIATERRPKSEVASDAVSHDAAIGMQVRQTLRGGQVLRSADLAKPDLVVRDQGVTLIYRAAGLYLTARGKALDTGAEGDVVSVLNLQSKRTITGTVIGRGQVAITVISPRLVASATKPE